MTSLERLPCTPNALPDDRAGSGMNAIPAGNAADGVPAGNAADGVPAGNGADGVPPGNGADGAFAVSGAQTARPTGMHAPQHVLRPPGYTPRRGAGLSCYERVLARAGLGPVAGVDEAGRGACAGPLVVAAVILPPTRTPIAQLADSKALAPAVREDVYRRVVEQAIAWRTVIIPPAEIDRVGLHVCNVAGMRRALAGMSYRPGYVITDGFAVRGLTVPALAMWKGDQVAACVAAASVVAKVTRDRIMTELHDRYPCYDFADHKGYVTPGHAQALVDHGPCPEHRFSFVNVIGALRTHGARAVPMPENGEMADVTCAADEAGSGLAAGPGDEVTLADAAQDDAHAAGEGIGAGALAQQTAGV